MIALLDCQFHSYTLDLDVSMKAILPEHRLNSHKELPVLYLLHGLSDNESKWMRYTSIERYVEDRELAVIMPSADRSFYTNMEHGPSYFTYIAEEVPEMAGEFFRLSRSREHTYIAGLSMGGYGAVKTALTFPWQFAAAASLSGSVDIEDRRSSFPSDFNHIFGNRPIKGSGDDLYHLAGQLSEGEKANLRLYLACGTEDHNYQANTHFYSYASQAGLNITFESGEGGHAWGYWDQQIQRVLEFFGI
ncbi:alpha/beta hydrolase [Halobacillus sp. Marseille-P3879]|uniref:alpha/beta hydrolase n=1 Tax=Halobacillus sp. Marseille-P3879 TaxID=2045014 RepID=UPI00358EFBFC